MGGNFMLSKFKVFLPSLFIALFLVMGITCFAADSDFQFDVETGTITKYQGTETNVTIPTTIAGYPVRKIGQYAFEKCDTVVSVSINNNIEEIGMYAFGTGNGHIGPQNLKTVLINADTLIFESGVFSNSKLENITINCTNSISFEKSYTFYECENLKSVILPKGTKNLSFGMFEFDENLESVTLPDGLESIGERAFSNCSSLKSIKIPSTVTEVENAAFRECSSLEKISIPNSVTGALSDYMFENCKHLYSVEIGSGITTLKQGVFINTVIEELTLPANIEKVNSYGLTEMNNLSKLTIMNDNIDVGDELKKIPTNCVVYCGADSNGFKAAVSAGLKYVIIETASVSQTDTTVSGTPIAETTAVLSSQPLSVNGSSVSVEAYNINGSNYFKLRDIAYIINGTEKQFGISYNNSTNSISLLSNTAYQATGSELQKTGVAEIYTSPSIAAITLDGSAVTAQAYNINGSNYFKLRDLASLLD
ncbi:MAG: leucine-rich repeat domain-containing protein, partial [Clostridiales bacterium]|nr:leucine-rich repeat domain-containing protein [Clostridiales bacterium]